VLCALKVRFLTALYDLVLNFLTLLCAVMLNCLFVFLLC
jgi:hypothetical protein